MPVYNNGRQTPGTRMDMTSRERVLQALASATRLEILTHLAKGPLSAGEIATRFSLAKPTLSRHLSVLEGAGLVTSRRKGQYIIYAIIGAPVTAALTSVIHDLNLSPLIPAPDRVTPESPPRQDNAAATNIPPVTAWMRHKAG